MNRGQFNETEPVTQKQASEFVGFAARSFRTLIEVFVETRTVQGNAMRSRTSPDVSCTRHAVVPKNRTTKTKASSFPRKCCLRMRSAQRCGVSTLERSRTNSV